MTFVREFITFLKRSLLFHYKLINDLINQFIPNKTHIQKKNRK